MMGCFAIIVNRQWRRRCLAVPTRHLTSLPPKNTAYRSSSMLRAILMMPLLCSAAAYKVAMKMPMAEKVPSCQLIILKSPLYSFTIIDNINWYREVTTHRTSLWPRPNCHRYIIKIILLISPRERQCWCKMIMPYNSRQSIENILFNTNFL